MNYPFLGLETFTSENKLTSWKSGQHLFPANVEVSRYWKKFVFMDLKWESILCRSTGFKVPKLNYCYLPEFDFDDDITKINQCSTLEMDTEVRIKAVFNHCTELHFNGNCGRFLRDFASDWWPAREENGWWVHRSVKTLSKITILSEMRNSAET